MLRSSLLSTRTCTWTTGGTPAVGSLWGLFMLPVCRSEIPSMLFMLRECEIRSLVEQAFFPFGYLASPASYSLSDNSLFPFPHFLLALPAFHSPQYRACVDPIWHLTTTSLKDFLYLLNPAAWCIKTTKNSGQKHPLEISSSTTCPSRVHVIPHPTFMVLKSTVRSLSGPGSFTIPLHLPSSVKRKSFSLLVSLQNST